MSPELIAADVRCSPAGAPKGTVIFLHSGGFIFNLSVDTARQICAEWAAAGYAVDVVSYPLGDVFGAEAASERAAAVAPVLPVVAVGESAGGTLAEWLAVRGDAAAAIGGGCEPT